MLQRYNKVPDLGWNFSYLEENYLEELSFGLKMVQMCKTNMGKIVGQTREQRQLRNF